MRAGQEASNSGPTLERAVHHALRTQVSGNGRLRMSDLLVAVRWLTRRPELEAADLDQLAAELIEKSALRVRLHHD